VSTSDDHTNAGEENESWPGLAWHTGSLLMPLAVGIFPNKGIKNLIKASVFV